MLDPSHHQSPDEPSHVLLVQDVPDEGRPLRETFETTTCETDLHVVTTGQEALEFLTLQASERSASIPDFAVLDLALPDRDEHEVLETIRDEPRLQCLPTIMLTSSDVGEEIAKCYGAHVNCYLRKPADPDEFPSVVADVEQFWREQLRLPSVSQ